MNQLDAIIVVVFLAVDEVRNGFFSFLAGTDVFTLVVLLGIAYYLRKTKPSLFEFKSLKLV